MNMEEIKGNWNQVKGKVKQQWGELTDDNMDWSEGHRDQLVGKIQERYGKSLDEARKEVDDFLNRL